MIWLLFQEQVFPYPETLGEVATEDLEGYGLVVIHNNLGDLVYLGSQYIFGSPYYIV